MKTGCNNGCIHKKEIKLSEMRENYDFRCVELGSYMKYEDVKKNCRMYASYLKKNYQVRHLTITDFLPD